MPQCHTVKIKLEKKHQNPRLPEDPGKKLPERAVLLRDSAAVKVLPLDFEAHLGAADHGVTHDELLCGCVYQEEDEHGEVGGEEVGLLERLEDENVKAVKHYQ
jgi:hypothetical protein